MQEMDRPQTEDGHHFVRVSAQVFNEKETESWAQAAVLCLDRIS